MTNSFEAIPEDREESFPCDCGGNITRDPDITTRWSCDNCDWHLPPEGRT